MEMLFYALQANFGTFALNMQKKCLFAVKSLLKCIFYQYRIFLGVGPIIGPTPRKILLKGLLFIPMYYPTNYVFSNIYEYVYMQIFC